MLTYQNISMHLYTVVNGGIGEWVGGCVDGALVQRMNQWAGSWEVER